MQTDYLLCNVSFSRSRRHLNLLKLVLEKKNQRDELAPLYQVSSHIHHQGNLPCHIFFFQCVPLLKNVQDMNKNEKLFHSTE